jgi:hypothetical protein
VETQGVDEETEEWCRLAGNVQMRQSWRLGIKMNDSGEQPKVGLNGWEARLWLAQSRESLSAASRLADWGTDDAGAHAAGIDASSDAVQPPTPLNLMPTRRKYM